MSQEMRRSAALTRRAFVQRAAAGAPAVGFGLRCPSEAPAATPPATRRSSAAGGVADSGHRRLLRRRRHNARLHDGEGDRDPARAANGVSEPALRLAREVPERRGVRGLQTECAGRRTDDVLRVASAFPVKSAGWSGHGDLRTTSYGQGIDRITNGEFDSYWRSVALGLRALGVPVIFRLWQEPNGPHNPYYGAWQGGLGTGGETAFVAAWRHIWTVFNVEKATLGAGGNCIWVFCAQQTTRLSNTGGPWQPYWPGGDVVDWSGMDLYRETFPFEAVNPPVYGSFYQWAVDNQKPFMICESGFQKGKIVTDLRATTTRTARSPATA